jgi:TfoX/Sxy family transcriptional regulator of competence genes
MATTQDYIEYVCERLPDCGNVRYRKMFGEYMVYINDKPLLTAQVIATLEPITPLPKKRKKA